MHDRILRKPTEPNQALEPTALLVTPRAFARVAPSSAVAHLERSAKRTMQLLQMGIRIFSALAATLLLAIGVYAVLNKSGHTGMEPFHSYWIFAPLLIAGIASIILAPNEKRKDGISAAIIGLSGILFVLYLDRTNTLLEYGRWIERGMP